jgi:hypothetical protein
MTIDPGTETIEPDAIPVSSGSSKWNGGVLAPNGKIYCIPRDSDEILIIDPQRNTAEYITDLPTSNKWAGGVLAPDGKIYGMPRDYDSILIIDPKTSSANPDALAVPDGDSQWTGGVLAPNGKVYGIPNYADSVLIIDVHSNGEVFDSIAECAYFNKF